MSPSALEHFILTRFNTRAAYLSEWPGADPEWLERRFALFERLCVPSVARQRAIFRWLVFFDASTPDPFLARIERDRQLGAFEPIFVDGVLTDVRIGEFVGARCRSAGHLLTTRLDNDDAIHDRFIAEVQQAFVPVDAGFVNFPLGFQYRGGCLFLYLSRSNPFISLMERRSPDDGAPLTVYCGPHERLRAVAPVRQLLAPPRWMQVIHGGNLANEVRGLRWPVGRMPAGFAGCDVPVRRDPPLRAAGGMLLSLVEGPASTIRQGTRRRARAWRS
jgi:hypothetical protein